MSNLVTHAETELRLLGEDQDTVTGYLQVIRAFAEAGHSGGSAMYAIPVINALLQFKNLTPLTTSSWEWEKVGPDFWQNRRRSEAFSKDAGKTYYLISEKKKRLRRRKTYKSSAPEPA